MSVYNLTKKDSLKYELDAHGKIMNIRQVSKYLGIHIMTTYRLAKQGKLPGFRVGGGWRFHKDVLDKFIERDTDASDN